MKQTADIMGMPITVEILNQSDPGIFNRVFDYFREVDARFSTYKPTSEISQINQGSLKPAQYSQAMREVLKLSEQTRQDTQGYFNIQRPDGIIDPSGLVKGWAIFHAAKILDSLRIKDYYIEAGGDIQAAGHNPEGSKWRVGIRNPFNLKEIVKVLSISSQGVATSGSYERGQHIYDPVKRQKNLDEIVSLTVIGPNVYEADRMATAAFAMGRAGIMFIESLPGFEGYMIDKHGIGTETSGFQKFII